jgi:predicted amidophosphoribosyltransferase
MSDHIGETNGMIDHIVEPTKMVCPHCGLPADRNQNGIQGYRCGSSYCESFKPQWARSMTCLELQNGQLQERIKRMKVAGDAMAHDHNPFTYMDWQRAKEDKP